MNEPEQIKPFLDERADQNSNLSHLENQELKKSDLDRKLNDDVDFQQLNDSLELVEKEKFIPITAGTLLRKLRESKGLHIAALAYALKVDVSKLEALESDQLELLPDVNFARALAFAVCRYLLVDSGEILKLMPKSSSNNLKSYSPRFISTYTNHSKYLTLKYFVSGIPWRLTLLVLIILGYLIFSQTQFNLFKSINEFRLIFNERAIKLSDQDSLNLMIDQKSKIFTPVNNDMVLTPSVQTNPQEVNLESIQLADIAGESISGLGLKTGILVIKGLGPSWVQVTDAIGQVQIQKIINFEETVGISGVLPLAVVIGHVKNTNVWVRDREFDLNTVSNGNVARFEVN